MINDRFIEAVLKKVDLKNVPQPTALSDEEKAVVHHAVEELALEDFDKLQTDDERAKFALGSSSKALVIDRLEKQVFGSDKAKLKSADKFVADQFKKYQWAARNSKTLRRLSDSIENFMSMGIDQE
jgi:hypothetical protein